MAGSIYVDGKGTGTIAIDAQTTLVIGGTAGSETTDGVPYQFVRNNVVVASGFLRGSGYIGIPD